MPTLVDHPPEGDGWIHEVKFDGYRSQLIIDEDGTRIRRNCDPWLFLTAFVHVGGRWVKSYGA
nr:hypothetical protein [Mesorhizobium japonicum]